MPITWNTLNYIIAETIWKMVVPRPAKLSCGFPILSFELQPDPAAPQYRHTNLLYLLPKFLRVGLSMVNFFNSKKHLLSDVVQLYLSLTLDILYLLIKWFYCWLWKCLRLSLLRQTHVQRQPQRLSTLS